MKYYNNFLTAAMLLLFTALMLPGSGAAAEEGLSGSSDEGTAVTKERKPRVRPRSKKKVYSSDVPGVKVTLVDINSEMFLNQGIITVVDDKHLAEGEKFRVKILGSGGLTLPPTAPSDWTPYTTMMFSVFVEGNDDWKGSLVLLDKTSVMQAEKNSRFKTGAKGVDATVASIQFTLKKGENKDFKIKIPAGLQTTDKSRRLELNNVSSFTFYGSNKKVPIYINNIYLVNEKAAVTPAAK